MVLPHYLLIITWVAAVIDKPSNVQWSPTCESDTKHFTNESPCYVAGIEIAPQQTYRHEINYECQDGADHHLVVNFMHLGEHVKDLTDNQGTECNGHNIGVALMEPDH